MADNAHPQVRGKWSGLGVRTVSGIVCAAIGLGAVWVGGWVFNTLVVLAGIQMWREWRGMTKGWGVGWTIFGVFYILIPCASLIAIEKIEHGQLILVLIITITSTDIFAYLTGKTFGGLKLAPSISPNKTWAGAIGGIFGSWAGILIYLICVKHFAHPFSITIFLWISLLSIVSQLGDLFESWIKRRANVKNSSEIIPGHGGLLDRFDGYMFVATLIALLVIITICQDL